MNEDKIQNAKRSVAMIFVAAWVTLLALIMGVGAIYLFVFYAPNANYKLESIIVVRRYIRTVDRLNDLENEPDVSLIMYRIKLAEILCDFKEARTEMDEITPPTSPDLITFDNNLENTLDAAIISTENEIIYLAKINPISDEMKQINIYRQRIEMADTVYEKMVYTRKHDYLIKRIRKSYDENSNASFMLEQYLFDMRYCTEEIAPQIEDIYSEEAATYRPATIYLYLQ